MSVLADGLPFDDHRICKFPRLITNALCDSVAASVLAYDECISGGVIATGLVLCRENIACALNGSVRDITGVPCLWRGVRGTVTVAIIQKI